MTNEDIRKEVLTHQAEIQKILAENTNTFVLNEGILKHKKAIDELRKQCSHVNANHEVETFNNHCVYCGKKMR